MRMLDSKYGAAISPSMSDDSERWTFAQADDPATPKRNLTSDEIEFFAKIEAADLVAQKAQQFGRVSKIVLPFSAQLKEELRDFHPEDEAVYNRADELQKNSANTYLLLRSLTYASFFVFMTAVVTLCYFHSASGDGPMAWTKDGLLLNTTIALMAYLFYWIRRALRGHILYNVIQNQVSRLSFALAQAKNDLEKEISGASGRIDLRQDPALPNLPQTQRAYGWTKVLLWGAKRWEGLDRYATTVLWKMDLFDGRVELAGMIAKGATLAAGLLAIWLGRNFDVDVAVVAASAISTVAFVWVWVLSNRAPADYWRQLLVREVVRDEKQKKAGAHYFNIMAVRVQNLVAQMKDAGRISEKQPVQQ